MSTTRGFITAIITCGLLLATSAASAQEGHEGHNHGGDAAGKASKMRISEVVHDFGEAWIGSHLKHTFIVRNEGEGMLELTKVKPSCGCTVAKFDQFILPGKTGTITAALNSSKLADGRFTKSIAVTCNDPGQRKLSLQLTGEVKHYVELTPRTAAMGDIKPEGEKIRTIRVTNAGQRPLQVSLKRSEGRFFTVQLVESKIGQQYDLVVKTRPPYVEGSVRDTIVLKTNYAAQSEIRIPVTANVISRLEVMPRQLTFLKVLQEPKIQRISFKNSGTVPVRVTEATTDDPELQLVLREIKAGTRYEVLVNAPTGYKPATATVSIALKTDDTEQPLIRVPIRSSMRPPKPAEALVGRLAPAANFQTEQGNSIDLTALDGPTVLKFYVSWCPRCKKSLPRLEQLHQKYRTQGVRFIAMNMDERPDQRGKSNPRLGRRQYSPQRSQEVLSDLGITFDVYFDHLNEIAKPLFKVTGYPALFVLDRSGRVVKYHSGQLAADNSRPKAFSSADLEKLIQQLLTEDNADVSSAGPKAGKGRALPE